MSQLVQVTNNEIAYTPDQLKLITDTVAKGASPDELKLFLYRCKSMGFDPLKPGQIHFIKYGNGPGTIVVGIDGFRARAMRSGKLNGISRGVIRNDKGQCIGAWAEVKRKDWEGPARIEVALSEYSSGKGPWQKMPESMIQKVAEAAALRMAFPDDLGGMYTHEEMDQAREAMPVIAPQQPEEGDGVPRDIGYRIPFGKFAKRALEEIDLNELRSYVDYIENKAVKDGKPLTGPVLEFVERACSHIAAFENGTVEEV